MEPSISKPLLLLNSEIKTIKVMKKEKLHFTPGDKIVWDSGFGYEIGYFVSASEIIKGTYLVDIITGRYQGEMSHSISQIKPYSEELIKELTLKYGYQKFFSKVF